MTKNEYRKIKRALLIKDFTKIIQKASQHLLSIICFLSFQFFTDDVLNIGYTKITLPCNTPFIFF